MHRGAESRGVQLFIGPPDNGDRGAVRYSLVVSYQRRGHNPHDYLRDVLARLQP